MEISRTIEEAGEIIGEVGEEIARAKTKFPSWPKDHIHAAAIVAEEAGELVRAALQHKYERGDVGAMRNEAVQCAAMCLRFLVGLKADEILEEEAKDE